MSPDGRFVAYAAEPREASTDHYIYVFDTVSLRETAIVTAAGSREAPVWTPDGGHLLYEEGEALKSVAVHDGQPAGEPRILHNGFSGMAIGVTGTGTFHYTNATGGGNYHFIGTEDAVSGRAAVDVRRNGFLVVAGRPSGGVRQR